MRQVGGEVPASLLEPPGVADVAHRHEQIAVAQGGAGAGQVMGGRGPRRPGRSIQVEALHNTRPSDSGHGLVE